MQQRLQHQFYDSSNPSQSKTPQNSHSQYESQIDSPQIDQRTPKCITQRNSQIVSNNTLSPYLRNIIINEQQLNQQFESTPSEITQYVQQKAKQIPYNQQNFSGGNIISSQQQHLKESAILNNYNSSGRTYNQNQQNFRSEQLNNNNHNQFMGIENDNLLEIRNDHQVITNSVNDNYQNEINYSKNNMNIPLNNYQLANQMKQGNKDEQNNNYYIISSLQSTSQNGSADVSQYGNTIDNKYPHQYNSQPGQGYSSKLQNDLQQNQIKNIEQENLLSQMQEKIKFLTTENEEQKKKIRNFNQQVQNGGSKSQTTHLYEKLNTISNQIESLSNSQLKLDLKKLNTQNSSQFRIDSSRSQITKSEFDQTPKESMQMENLEKYRKNQTKKKSKNHHRHKKNSSNKKKRNRSSSNSSITSSSNSSDYSGSSRDLSSSSSHSSFDSDQDNRKYLKRNFNKSKGIKEYNSKREEILQDRSKNRSVSKREKSKSKHRKQKTEGEILKLGSLLIKEVNLNRKLRDLFMNTIGSTEQFRRMLVEKKFTNAFLGVLKVFLDVLAIISFSKKSSSPPAHSPSSYSPMNQLTNTSTFTTQSNILQRNPILSQSRFNIPSHLQLKNLDLQSQPLINQNYQSPQNGYIAPHMTDRIYSQHSNGQHSPLTSHSFISVKQANQHFPTQVSHRDYSPLDHGLSNTNNQQSSNIYYQMNGQNQQLRQKANMHNNGNHIYDLNLSNINRKTSNHNINSQSVTGQNSGSDTYRQHFDSFNHPSPTIIQNKQVYQSQNDIQKFVSSPYFNQANSSTKKQMHEEGIKIQQHYMRKLNNENDWNENSIQDESEQYEEIQSQNNLRSVSNNRNHQNYDKSKEQHKQQIHNKQTKFQEERGYQNPNRQNNYQYDESEYSQNILISKQNSIQSQNSHISLNQKSYQNLQQKSNVNHNAQDQSRNKSRSTSPYNQVNQDQKQQNKVRQTSQQNQVNNIKQTENTLSVQRLQNKSINHVISPRSAISPLKNSNIYQISSSVPEIEMDSDSQEVNQQSEKQIQTLKKQQKTTKNDKLAASTRNKSSNRSFVFDDDQLSSNSTTNNKQKHVGFTPKQSTTPRDRDKKSSHSPAIGLMPCMKSVRASHNGAITPSKSSMVNIKTDLSSKGSHTNLDNSFYSNKNQSTNEHYKPIKQSPIGIEFVGAKRKIQPDSSKTRDFDIINGNIKQQQNQQNTQEQQQEKKIQNQNQIPQIKIVDADPITPNSQNKQNYYHTDNTQTPTLKQNGQ
ncbi:hypothetical protein ABPG74_001618 [Tetrahymena malaccensis]